MTTTTTSGVAAKDPAHLRFASYNLLDYGYPAAKAAEEVRRRDGLHAVIRDVAPDVLAVQEIRTGDTDAEKAGDLLRAIAAATNLNCELPTGAAAIALGANGFHVGMLWSEAITPVGSRTWGSHDMWHSAIRIIFDHGGARVAHTSYHATPFGRHRRADEAERVVSIMTRPSDRPPGLIGADWNGISADRIDGSAEFYDPDPYAGLPWHPGAVYQCRWTTDSAGIRTWEADREAGEILAAGGLTDVAATLRAPQTATAGHWKTDDPFGHRRIDAIRVTNDVTPALRAYGVADTTFQPPAGTGSDPGPPTVDPRTCSDHLLVYTDYDPASIERTRG